MDKNKKIVTLLTNRFSFMRPMIEELCVFTVTMGVALGVFMVILAIFGIVP